MPQSAPRVLIIDDDISTVRLMADALVPDYDVIFATQADDGFKQALERQPELVLLDIVMPEINGFDFCRRLKADERTQSIPVIFVSALDTVAEQTKGFELGAVDYITKPVELPILRARVRTHTRLYRQTRQLESLAATDSLTGLSNRRKFDDVLKYEVDRVNRQQTALSLLIIDIDDFKAFNDHYGHGRGDDCLVNVARLLRKNAERSTDIVCRLGGEEFGIVLPETGLEGAMMLANHIVADFNRLKMTHERAQSHDYLTVSIGIGVIDFDKVSPGQVKERRIVDVADEALYRAKHNGRNRVEYAYVKDEQLNQFASNDNK